MAIDQGVRSKKETKADAQSVIDLAHKQGLKIVDLKFIDLIGTWQHFSIPVQEPVSYTHLTLPTICSV